MNDAILYPTYNQPDNDQKAAQILAQAFPEKDIVGIDCCPLIKQHGSLHCVTMQYPESVKTANIKIFNRYEKNHSSRYRTTSMYE